MGHDIGIKSQQMAALACHISGSLVWWWQEWGTTWLARVLWWNPCNLAHLKLSGSCWRLCYSDGFVILFQYCGVVFLRLSGSLVKILMWQTGCYHPFQSLGTVAQRLGDSLKSIEWGLLLRSIHPVSITGEVVNATCAIVFHSHQHQMPWDINAKILTEK